MSIAIVVSVSEGLVLGADSAATLSGRANTPKGTEEGVLKTFFNARKLLQVGDLPIGVLTWGIGQIGSRTIESLIREWEHKQHWLTNKDYKEHHDSNTITVKKCAEELLDFLKKAYENSEVMHLPENERPILGIVVAGYSEGEFFPEIWRFIIPVENQISNQRPNQNNQPNFGASWFGLTDAVIRLHWGRDDAIIKILSDKFNVSEAEVLSLLAPAQYPVPFAVMPLQDAIEYAYYMINVTIGRYRFVIGPELCGGPIEIAAITPNGFNWISRKSWKLVKGE